MLVIMCGMPFSGKSSLVDMLVGGSPNGKVEFNGKCVLRPSDWLPDGSDKLGYEAIKDYRIICWKMALEKAEEALSDFNNKEIIVLDQGNRKYKTVDHLIKMARHHHHSVILVYVNAKSSICRSRVNGASIGESVWLESVEDVMISLPKYKDSCDKFIVIDNNMLLEDLRIKADELKDSLCQDI